MNSFLLILSVILIITGLIGSFIPIIPGPITSWFGLFTLSQIQNFPNNNTLLITTFVIGITIFILDYFIPIIGSKYFGGSKYGIIGTSIGLLIGLISPVPFGIIIGAFLGALIGEILAGKQLSEGIKPAMGSLIGIITSSVIKFFTAVSFLVIYIILVITNWGILF
ncbi:MAG: hypothetical protein ACI8PF_000687 [Flavobacteriaceae bacterium]|jgi:uncharacterized protein YqgC (DUF456 family)|tara:strand:+ start:2237 stop:2734 length:498 start_codon:yes stop_codon:yes gene_type:complete